MAKTYKISTYRGPIKHSDSGVDCWIGICEADEKKLIFYFAKGPLGRLLDLQKMEISGGVFYSLEQVKADVDNKYSEFKPAFREMIDILEGGVKPAVNSLCQCPSEILTFLGHLDDCPCKPPPPRYSYM
jgi:hypothetical protein